MPQKHLAKRWFILIILVILILLSVVILLNQQGTRDPLIQKSTGVLDERIVITLDSASQDPNWEIAAFDKNIKFNIKEWFSEIDFPHLFMNVLTTEEYPCMDVIIEGGKYRIDRDVYFEDNKLTIDFLGVDKRAITECKYAIPATGEFNFRLPPIMREPGSYILEFKSQNTLDTYEIIVSKEKIVIEPNEQNFSNTTSLTIERLPEHLLWVTCSYDWRVHNPNDNQCPTFFNEIATKAQPYLDTDKNKILKLQYYIYEGDIEILLDIAKKYDSKGHFIKFNMWNGQSMHSNNLFSHVTKTYYPEPIITEYETVYNDTSKCDITKSRVEYYGCMQNVALYTRDETICGYAAYDPDKCYNDIGKATLNEALCTRLANWKNYYRDCFEYIAVEKQDPTICENIDSASDKGDCYENYAVKTRDEKYCEKAFSKDRCYKKL